MMHGPVRLKEAMHMRMSVSRTCHPMHDAAHATLQLKDAIDWTSKQRGQGRAWACLSVARKSMSSGMDARFNVSCRDAFIQCTCVRALSRCRYIRYFREYPSLAWVNSMFEIGVNVDSTESRTQSQPNSACKTIDCIFAT